MRLNEKLLNKSKSYVYYKSGFESMQKELAKKNKLIKGLKKEIKNKNNSINGLKQKNEDCGKLISVLEGHFHDSTFNSLNKNIKKINIAYVLSGFPVHSETFVVNEVKWLKENGFNIFVFIRQDSFKSVSLDFDVEIVKFNSIVDLERLMIEYQIDVMHTHFVYSICTNFTWPIAEKLKIPFTVFAHAYDIFMKESDEKNRIDEISNSRFCIAIFTLSNFHKNYLLDRGVDEDKILITKQATSYELSKINRKPNSIKNIIAVSRFVEKKGLDVLIDAANLLRNEVYSFSIYGFGDLEGSLQKQIDDLGCTNISIEGELPPGDVELKLKESDLLVSPCKIAKNGDRDGFPTVIFESMAVGLPVLTTNVSAIPEIITDGVNGFLVEPDDPKELADKIREISRLSDDELMGIVEKAQNDVKNISSVDKTMDKYIEVLSNNINCKVSDKDFLIQKLIENENGFIFSVIIPVFNTEKYLKEAIDSIITQEFLFEKIQIILVDDGSTDNSKEICMEYLDKYPNNFVYVYQENQGQANARNNGLKYAEGKYLSFLDSDDKLESGTFKEIYYHFIKFDDDVDVISIPRYFFGAVNNYMANSERYFENRIVDIKNEFDFPQVSISASFVKKDALCGEFDTRLIISEDSLLLNKTILNKCKFGVVGNVKYLYRKRDEGNSTIDTKKTKKEYFSQRMELYFKELINYSLEKYGHVPKYIQSVLIYDLRWLFEQKTEKNVLSPDEKREYYNHIFDVLQHIDDDLIISQDFNEDLKKVMIDFKYDKI